MLPDASLVAYIGLVILWVWRWFCPWRCCGVWLRYCNCLALLYVLLCGLVIAGTVAFLREAVPGPWDSPDDPAPIRDHLDPAWLRPMMLFAPVSAILTLILCAMQSVDHVDHIRRQDAPLKHDRAVQIVALPAVYGVMSLNALSREYLEFNRNVAGGSPSALQHTLTHVKGVAPDDRVHLDMEQSETCYWVGDLYEAWAMYQFSRLTLELISASLNRAEKGHTRKDHRSFLERLKHAHEAVESLAWMGVFLFVIMCVVQAGWSLYLLTVAHPTYADYSLQIAQMSGAGWVASCAAIWNVHVVESTFHMHMEGFRPFLKFVTVKILVSIAFFQTVTISLLKVFEGTLPILARSLIAKVPVIADILHMPEQTFKMFYAALLVHECLIIAILHLWAWSPDEPWYVDEVDIADSTAERKPLLSDCSSQQGSDRSGGDGARDTDDV